MGEESLYEDSCSLYPSSATMAISTQEVGILPPDFLIYPMGLKDTFPAGIYLRVCLAKVLPHLVADMVNAVCLKMVVEPIIE